MADTVDEIFGGDVAEFLREAPLIFDDIRAVLDQQFVRLSTLEQGILFGLAVAREATPAPILRQNLFHPPPQRLFLEALRNLQRTSLVERHDAGFALQHVVSEYLTDRLVDGICQEILTGEIQLLRRQALLKAQAKAYVRESQARLILQPIGARLVDHLGRPRLAEQMQQILATLRKTEPQLPSYAAGNILNLLLQLGMDVADYDFSRLKLWQVYLQGLHVPAVNFAGADLNGFSFFLPDSP